MPDDIIERATQLRNQLGDSVADDPIRIVLPYFLCALDWQGRARELAASLARKEEFDLTQLRNALATLGYPTVEGRTWLRSGLPSTCLILEGDAIRLVYPDEYGRPCCFNPVSEQHEPLPLGRCHFIAPAEQDIDDETDTPTLKSILKGMDKVFVQGLVLSLFSNLLAIALPLFVMVVYDKVISSRSTDSLYLLVAGVTLALLLDTLLRLTRSKMFAFAGSRAALTVGNKVFGLLLNATSPRGNDTALVTQLNRVRDGDQLRQVVSGPLGQSCMDLPFVFLFLVTISIIGGPLVWVSVISITVYVAAAIFFVTRLNAHIADTAKFSNQRQALFAETINRMHSIRASALESRYLERFSKLTYRVSAANMGSTMLNASITTLGQTLTGLTALATLGLGIGLVLEGDITTGALIATMTLLWRAMGPLQSTFAAVSRFNQARTSMAQVNRLLETHPPAPRAPHRTEADPSVSVVFDRVTFRYGTHDPALSGLTLQVDPLDVVAVVGRSGSGKTTLLKLIAGAHEPQVGSINIGGRDVRQYRSQDLQQFVAYVPQSDHPLGGTIREILSLGDPYADDTMMWQALQMSGALKTIENLGEGLDTRLDPFKPQQVPSSTYKLLSLARAYLQPAPIVLFDEPVNGLDYEQEFNFIEALHQLRTKKTIFLVTHRPSHMLLCNKTLLLDRGNLAYFGNTDKVE
ncbi:MAG: ATP-binding cassette domain-containing protein, partial [Pseudomonadota bacterium]